MGQNRLLIQFLLCTILFCSFSLNKSLAQKKIDPRNSNYEELKGSGKLKDYHVEYNTNTERIVPRLAPRIHQNNPSQQSVNTCNCWVPLDSTFTIVPFSGVSPPEYRNDDLSTTVISIPFTFCFYGQNITDLYINNNGNVSFGGPVGVYSASPFPIVGSSMVAPFWADVDTRNLMSGLVYYELTPTHLIVQWDTVGYYGSHADLLNTFQLIMTDGTDPLVPGGNNVSFCYKDMQWTTGDASQGSGGFGGVPATVGANLGDGVSFIQFGRFDSPGTTYTGPYPVGPPYEGVSWLDYQSFLFSTCSATNIPPIVSGLTSCDTLFICEGDTLYLNADFLSPEAGQITTDTAYADSLGTGFYIISTTPGNTASIATMFIGDSLNHGFNLLTFSATDNGVPAQTTIVNIVVHVDTFAMPHPVLQGDTLICPGVSDTLSLITPGYDTYLWSTGETTPTIVVSAAGTYTCTVTFNGCWMNNSFTVTVGNSVLPVITGPNHLCHQDSANVSVQSNYLSYLWSNGFTGINQVVDSGIFTVTVTDQYGCTMTSPPDTIRTTDPQVAITGVDSICANSTTVLAATFGLWSFQWSNGATTAVVTVPPGSYTVLITDSFGCTDTASHIVVGIPLPTPVITGTLNYCQGANTTLTATPAGFASYTWSNSSTANPITVTAGTYSVTVTDAIGCSGTSPAVTVSEFPVPTPVILGAASFCAGGSTVLSVDSVYPGYVWSSGSTSSTVSTDSTGTYTVTVTDVNGCTGTSPAVTVTEWPLPTPEILGAGAFCIGGTASLVVDSSYSSYLWSTGATTQGTTTTGDGTFSVIVTDANGCTGTSPAVNTSFGPVNIAAFSTNPPDTAFADTMLVYFYDQSATNWGSIIGWSWSFGDGDSSFVQNPTHTYMLAGRYIITLFIVTSDGCTDTISHYIDVITWPVIPPNVFSPGGNGLNDFLHFRFLEFHPNSRLLLYNRWGTKIYENANYQNDWAGGYAPDGVYYYVLHVSNAPTLYGFITLLRDK